MWAIWRDMQRPLICGELILCRFPPHCFHSATAASGGKTGVDFDGYKNMVGAFKMPKLVYMNLSVLQTLDDRQFFSGFAEVMKHGLIRDAVFYDG